MHTESYACVKITDDVRLRRPLGCSCTRFAGIFKAEMHSMCSEMEQRLQTAAIACQDLRNAESTMCQDLLIKQRECISLLNINKFCLTSMYLDEYQGYTNTLIPGEVAHHRDFVCRTWRLDLKTLCQS